MGGGGGGPHHRPTIEATIHVGGVVVSVGASWRPHHHHQGGGAQHRRRRHGAATRYDILIHGKLVVLWTLTYLPTQFTRQSRLLAPPVGNGAGGADAKIYARLHVDRAVAGRENFWQQ